MDDFTRGYIECALWASTDDNGDPLDEIDAELSNEASAQMEADCTSFQSLYSALLDEARDDFHISDESLGHDLWLTRNRHGTGYWDRGLGKLGDKLAAAARMEGSADLYVGDDGLIHHA